MDDLLAQVLDAHGGLDHWRSRQSITARISYGGAFWAIKAGPNARVNESVELENTLSSRRLSRRIVLWSWTSMLIV
jgi:hypothetical protein